MSREVIGQYAKTWYNRVVDQDREMNMSADEWKSLEEAWGKLTPSKIQCTVLVNKMLKQVFEERCIVEAWIEWQSGVLSEEWKALLLAKAPADGGGLGIGPSQPFNGGVTLEQGLKVSEVRQGGTDLVEHALQFEERMKMLRVPEARHLGLFEASLNGECRGSFWQAMRTGQDYADIRALVRAMLKVQGLVSVKAARVDLDGVWQRRGAGETASAFLSRLKTAVTKYEYRSGKTMAPEAVVELLLARLHDGQRIEALMDVDKMTVDEVIRLARVFEASGHERKVDRTGKQRPEVPSKPEAVTHKFRERTRAPEVSRTVKAQGSTRKECTHCGGRHDVTDCWTKYPEKRPHFRNQAQALAGRLVEGSTGGALKKILLDSCADVSCAKESAVESCWEAVDRAVRFMWGMSTVTTKKAYLVPIEVDGVSSREEVFIVDDELLGPEADMLLSSAAAERLGWSMRRASDEDKKEDVEELPSEAPVFADFVMITAHTGIRKAAERLPTAGSLNDLVEAAAVPAVQFAWDEKGLAEAKFSSVARGYRPEAEVHLRARAKEMVEAGIASWGDSIFASPWLTVQKPKGGWRECVDMRAINIYMRGSAFPCTTTKDVLRKLGDPRWKIFTELDLKVAFWQIPLGDPDRHRCAVRGPDGILLLMNRLPQGGKDSSAQLERILVDVLVRPFQLTFKDRAVLLVYRDNLFLGTTDEETHAEALTWIADRARELRFKFGSGTIGTDTVSVLGFELSPEHVRPARAALEKLGKLEKPRSRKALRAALGQYNYYRSVIPCYAGLAAPLEELTKGKAVFAWTGEHERAWHRLKAAVVKACTGRYSPGKVCTIYTDASDDAAGAALVQDGKIVAVFSRKFRGAQMSYSVTRREALALLWALQHFDDMLTGTTKVFTDHHALVAWSRGSYGSDPLLNRWGLKLGHYDADIQHVRGTDNGVADYLSRFVDGLDRDEQARVRSQRLPRGVEQMYNGLPRAPIDRSRRMEWLEELHVAANHAPVRAMLAFLEGQVDWPTKRLDVEEIVSVCDLCQREELARPPKPATLVAHRSAWRVFDEMSFDLITEMPLTKRGNRHTAHWLESFSGFSWLFPLKSREGADSAAVSLHLFYTVGFPRRVRCDRGEALSAEMVALFEWAGIEIKETSSHHPSANGQNERTNLEVRRELARMGDDDDWDLQLDAVAFFRNSRPPRRADITAFQLLFNVEPRLPMVAKLLPAAVEMAEEIGRPWEELVKSERIRRKLALEANKEAMRRYEGSRTPRQAGDLVLVRNFARKKGEPRWRGPYSVVEARARSLKLRTDAGRYLIVNTSDVKPYRQGPREADVGINAVPHANIDNKLSAINIQDVDADPIVSNPTIADPTVHDAQRDARPGYSRFINELIAKASTYSTIPSLPPWAPGDRASRR